MPITLLWKCRLGANPSGLPTGFVTFGPAFLDSNLPTEVLMLLPSTQGSTGLLRRIQDTPEITRGRGVGLFLGDPFLNRPQICALLGRLGVNWVANLPALAQHDEEFLHYAGDVGFSIANEIKALSAYRADGLKTLAVVSATSHCAALMSHPADAVLVVPNARELQVSFPSLPRRQTMVRDIQNILVDAGLDIPVIPLVTRAEGDLGGICAIERPVPVDG